MSEAAVDVGGEAPAAPTAAPPTGSADQASGSSGSILSSGEDLSQAPSPTDLTPGAPAAESGGKLPHFSDGFANVDLRTNPLVSGFESAEAMASEHVNLQSLIGRKGIIKPAEDAPPQHWEKFYNDMGRPATPGEYKLENFTRPEGVGWDVDKIETPMVARMHALGMTEDQVVGVFNEFAGLQVGLAQLTTEGIAAAADAGVVGLKSEWGLAFEAKVDLAVRAANKNIEGGAKTLEGMHLADGTSLADNPVVIKMLSTLGEIQAEAGVIGTMNQTANTLTPKDAEDAMRQHVAKFKDALLDNQHPNHDWSVNEKMRLRKLMNG